MTDTLKRSTIYFDPQLYAALRLKASHTQRTISDLVNEAVSTALSEDYEDLAAFTERADEPMMSYEELLNDLKAGSKL